MTIKYEKGNILDAPSGFICHQVNCRGLAGTGLALQISKCWPEVTKDYQEHVHVSDIDGVKLLGTIRISTNVNPSGRQPLFVMSLFCQDNVGHSRRHTNYGALAMSLNRVSEVVKSTGVMTNHNTNIYIPFGIGCGHGGGDWNVVKELIEFILGDLDVIIVAIK